MKSNKNETLKVYTVEFSSGDTWPTWAISEADAIAKAKDTILNLIPVKAYVENISYGNRTANNKK